MGESDLQAVSKKNSQNCGSVIISESTKADFSKELVQSLLKQNQAHDALNVYINAYSSDILDSTCLEVFVDGVVKKARETMTKNDTFSVGYFLCPKCCDVIRDPVTLKCGHTLSKKCLLNEATSDFVECKVCGKSYTCSYVSQLKTNVVASALVEKLWERKHSTYKQKAVKEIHNSQASDTTSYVQCDDVLRNASSSDSGDPGNDSSSTYSKDEELLVNFEKLEEVLKMSLISLAINPNSFHAKDKAIKILHDSLILVRQICKDGIPVRVNFTKCDRTHVCEEKETMLSNNQNKVLDFDSTVIKKLHSLLDDFLSETSTGKDFCLYRRDIPIDKREIECALCIRVLWEPVTTPCGHTFCRVCLNRCFDHQPICPLCKTSLSSFLAERIQSTTTCLKRAIKTFFPVDYAERKLLYEEEMKELSNAGKDPESVIPLFVCTTAYPTVPCPLHVFEPRYRLMIRQCMESGSRQFGMCPYINNDIAEYGTMLEIRDVKYFPDGRSVVDTIGSTRFRILKKGERDGYCIGAVEFLRDEPSTEMSTIDITKLHDEVYKISQAWFLRLSRDTKREILSHFGPMPDIEDNYIESSNGPSWFWWMVAVLPIDSKSQLIILSMTSLPRRLKTLYRVLLHVESKVL